MPLISKYNWEKDSFVVTFLVLFEALLLFAEEMGEFFSEVSSLEQQLIANAQMHSEIRKEYVSVFFTSLVWTVFDMLCLKFS